MRIESLNYFLEIARVGSFSLAARSLYVSQQGLSKSIQSLERELGVTLFERSGKRVRLTDAGAELVPLARSCVKSYRTLQDAMREHAGRAEGTAKLQLLAMPFITNGVFTIMKDELQAFSLRDVMLVERDLPAILREILEPGAGAGKAAMVVVSNNMLRCMLKNQELAFVPLFESDILLSATKDLVSPRKRCITPKEVSALPIVNYYEPMLSRILDDMFAEQPLRNIILNTTNKQMIEEYVQHGKAATFSDSFSAFLLAGKSNALYTPIKGASSFSAGFVYARNKDLDAETRTYIDNFKQCIQTTCKPYMQKHPVAG